MAIPRSHADRLCLAIEHNLIREKLIECFEQQLLPFLKGDDNIEIDSKFYLDLTRALGEEDFLHARAYVGMSWEDFDRTFPETTESKLLRQAFDQVVLEEQFRARWDIVLMRRLFKRFIFETVVHPDLEEFHSTFVECVIEVLRQNMEMVLPVRKTESSFLSF